jgi:fibronectin type 3 domain-containing protein
MKVDYVRVYQLTATLAAPDVPQEFVVASGVGQAALRWAVSANAETYNIKRATTRGGPYATIASDISGTSYTDLGLTNGTRYYYRVSAVSAVGESANSSERSAAPAATFSSQVVDNTDGTPNVQISAGWTASTASAGYVGTNYLHDGDTSGVGGKSVLYTPPLPVTTDYDVHLNWTAAGSRAVRVPIDIIHSGGTSTVYVDQRQSVGWYHLGTFSFANGTTGSVRVRNDMGTGGYGEVVADAVNFVQLTLPPPTGLSATAVSQSQINLAWTAANGAASYTVKRATVSGGPYSTVASGVTATTYMDTGRSANTTYYYVVSAVNATATSANSEQASAQTAPAVPTGLTAIAGDARVVLSWNASPGAASYRVRRSWVSGGALTVIGNPAVTSHIASPLTNGTPYFYVVSAVGANGVESTNSSEVTATPTTIAPIVKDNTDGTGITITGTWTTTTAIAGYYGTNYIYDNGTGTGGAKVKYTPTIATKAYYEVYVRWTAFSNRATNAPIDITHAGGTTTVPVNQTTNNGTWVSLGTFLFNTGTAGNVTVRNDGANGYVVADAVQLVFR